MVSTRGKTRKATAPSKPLIHNKCPAGYRRRKGYTRKNTGTHVKSICVRKTSPYAAPAQNTRKRQAARLARVLGTRKSCPPGMIARAAYVRQYSANVAKRGYTKKTPSGSIIRVLPKKRKSVFVPATCVKDVGKPGKLPEGAPRIGPLRQGELRQFGYSYKLPEVDRKLALQRAISSFGPLNTYRKLNAVAKLTTSAVPAASQVFASDRNWIRNTYANSNGKLQAF